MDISYTHHFLRNSVDTLLQMDILKYPHPQSKNNDLNMNKYVNNVCIPKQIGPNWITFKERSKCNSEEISAYRML